MNGTTGRRVRVEWFPTLGIYSVYLVGHLWTNEEFDSWKHVRAPRDDASNRLRAARILADIVGVKLSARPIPGGLGSEFGVAQ